MPTTNWQSVLITILSAVANGRLKPISEADKMTIEVSTKHADDPVPMIAIRVTYQGPDGRSEHVVKHNAD